LALTGITTIAAANRWLAETYWPAHNALAVAPAETGNVLRRRPQRPVQDIQEECRVGNDNTVKWRGLTLQIPPSPLRPHFARPTVRVHEYPDGGLAISHGPHRLADYDPAGNLCDDAKLAAWAASATRNAHRAKRPALT
jgi:hypothetical protein